MTEWAEAKGAWLAAGQGPEQPGRGLLPGGFVQFVSVSALCYCFSLFIKCVWITVEMLWFYFFFFNKDSGIGLKSLKSSLQPAALPAWHRYCIMGEEMCRFDTCSWLQFTSIICQKENLIRFWSLPRLLSGIKVQLKLVSDVFIYKIISNSTFILTISTGSHKQVEH